MAAYPVQKAVFIYKPRSDEVISLGERIYVLLVFLMCIMSLVFMVSSAFCSE